MRFNRIRKNHLLRISLLILLVALAACRRGGGNDIPEIGLDLATYPNPPAVGDTIIMLDLSDASGQPINGATVELEGNMSHAGMPPVLAQAVETEPGRYQTLLNFMMGGDWYILVKATLPDGRKLERQINLPAVISR